MHRSGMLREAVGQTRHHPAALKSIPRLLLLATSAEQNAATHNTCTHSHRNCSEPFATPPRVSVRRQHCRFHLGLLAKVTHFQSAFPNNFRPSESVKIT
eukprot:2182358-Amphidinium_carterae.1